MKNYKKREYCFFPPKDSKLSKRFYLFKYKQDLIKFLNNNIIEVLGGEVVLEVKSLDAFYSVGGWRVGYNHEQYLKGANPIAVLKKGIYLGRKFTTKLSQISKSSKKYFMLSDKVFKLMIHIHNVLEKGGTITPENAKNLVELFKKQGLKKFTPSPDDVLYIKAHLQNKIPFYYWSDRCNFVRAKTIIEYFKKENLI